MVKPTSGKLVERLSLTLI